MTQILLVENLPGISEQISSLSGENAMQYYELNTEDHALTAAIFFEDGLLVFDLDQPDIGAAELSKKLILWKKNPLIISNKQNFFTPDQNIDDLPQIKLLINQLLSRINKELYRLPSLADDTVFINGNLSIDRKACCVYINGQQVHLTPVEYKLLDLLARHIGQVLSYDFIISEVWGQNKQDTSSLRVFMSTLRKKVEKDPSHPVYLLTHPRIGYRMAQATMPEDDLS